MPRTFIALRSVLYVPGSNEKAIKKTRILPSDAIIFDLEDAVAPSAKEKARELVCKTVSEGGFVSKYVIKLYLVSQLA